MAGPTINPNAGVRSTPTEHSPASGANGAPSAAQTSSPPSQKLDGFIQVEKNPMRGPDAKLAVLRVPAQSAAEYVSGVPNGEELVVSVDPKKPDQAMVNGVLYTMVEPGLFSEGGWQISYPNSPQSPPTVNQKTFGTLVQQMAGAFDTVQ